MQKDIGKISLRISELKTGAKQLEELWNHNNDPLLKELRLEKEGFILPPPNSKYYRLYGHYLCPYVERVLLTLALKQIPFQFVSIDFPSRPKWYYDLPSHGKVPLLEYPNRSKYQPESASICKYLAQNFNSGIELIPKNDEVLEEQINTIMRKADELGGDYYGVGSYATETDSNLKDLGNDLNYFNELLNENKLHPYFFDQPHPSLADIML